jgi:uncharacterized membrane protein YoaK (UPF0700 family)
MAGAGGFLDAFTYIGHGHVFANAMTGNVVLLGVALAGGDRGQSVRHIVPIAAFVAGIVAARLMHEPPVSRLIVRPHLTCLIFEIVFLFAVGWLPPAFPDTVLTLGIAFVASLQLATFSKVRGAAYASTFTTGNLRKLAESLVNAGLNRRDTDARVLSLAFATVCAAFFVGATTGGVCTLRFANHAAWIVAGWLGAGTLLLVFTSAAANKVGGGTERAG